MARLESFHSEVGLYVLSGVFLAFVHTNFKPEVATGLGLLLLVSFMVFMFDAVFLDKKLSIPFSKPSMNWGKAIAYGTGFAVIFIFIGTFITNLPFLATAKLFQQATIPSFAKSVFLTLVTWVIVIPFIESITAVRIFEFLANRFKHSPFNLRNPIILLFIGIIGASALLFHSTAYGITNNKALILSLLFFGSGLILSIKLREARPFVVGHGVVNGLAFAT